MVLMHTHTHTHNNTILCLWAMVAYDETTRARGYALEQNTAVRPTQTHYRRSTSARPTNVGVRTDSSGGRLLGVVAAERRGGVTWASVLPPAPLRCSAAPDWVNVGPCSVPWYELCRLALLGALRSLVALLWSWLCSFAGRRGVPRLGGLRPVSLTPAPPPAPLPTRAVLGLVDMAATRAA